VTDEELARIETTLRTAPWDLPLREELVTAAVRARRKPRRRAAHVWIMSAAAVALVVAGGAAVRSVLATAAPAAAPLPAARPSATASAPGALSVGGFTFTAPPGFALVGRVSSSNRARFGPEGLVNDDEPLGPRDMRVTLESRMLQSQDGTRLVVTRIRPQPTAEHPGPRPAAVPTDAATATRTIVDLQGGIGSDADSRRAVPGLPVGPAVLVRFDERNAILLARPAAGPPEVLLFEVGRGSEDLLLELARSARR
jgi:hypothetical protein